MEKLTLEEKIKAYEWALNRIKNVPGSFICISLLRWVENEFSEWVYDYKGMMRKHFPEVERYKPINPDTENLGWWPTEDEESRIKVLTDILEKLKNQR